MKIELEFTEAQWVLIKQHLLLPDENQNLSHVETEEEFKSKLQYYVANLVQGAISSLAVEVAALQAKNAFDV